MGTRVLVTGAAGFIGRWLVPKLASRGAEVLAFDTPEGYKKLLEADRTAADWFEFNKQVKKLYGDMTEPDVLEDFQEGIDYVVHLAAIPVPRVCDANPQLAFNLNVNGTHNMLKFALQHGAKKFVFASSAHVYGISPRYLPTDEKHPLWVQDTYTCTKILGEQLCKLFYENHDLPYTILRLFNGYGPSQAEGYFIPDMIAQGKKGVIRLAGRHVTKDWIYVDDVADAFVRALDAEFVGPINIGSGAEVSLDYVAHYIAKIMGVKLTYTPETPGGPTRMACDGTRARKVLGWMPVTPIERGLEMTVPESLRKETRPSSPAQQPPGPLPFRQ